MRQSATMPLLWYCYDRDMPELCLGRNNDEEDEKLKTYDVKKNKTLIKGNKKYARSYALDYALDYPG